MRDCCKGLLEAISYCHEQGIVLRELKPSSIMFASTDKETLVKLADFSSARELDGPLTMRRRTADYLAPEIFMGNPFDKVRVFPTQGSRINCGMEGGLYSTAIFFLLSTRKLFGI